MWITYGRFESIHSGFVRSLPALKSIVNFLLKITFNAAPSRGEAGPRFGWGFETGRNGK